MESTKTNKPKILSLTSSICRNKKCPARGNDEVSFGETLKNVMLSCRSAHIFPSH